MFCYACTHFAHIELDIFASWMVGILRDLYYNINIHIIVFNIILLLDQIHEYLK